jgi:hypothetical protein
MSKDNSKLLIDEYPLQVLPTLACKIGLNSAIVLQQVHYWMGISKKAKSEKNFKGGRWWVYNTYEEWQENFPWWSLPTIKRTILRLETAKLLISREMEAQDWNHTKWYTIDYEALNGLIDCINVIPSEDSDLPDGTPQNDPLLKESETTTETTHKRGDLVDGYLDLAQSPGIKRAARLDAILSYLGGKLRINTETKRWKDFAKFVDDRQQAHHEPLDIFVSWLTSQKDFNIQFWSPARMQEMYPQAFLLENQPNTPQINAAAVEQTKQYNENRWNFTPAPPPANLVKPALKKPERRVRS